MIKRTIFSVVLALLLLPGAGFTQTAKRRVPVSDTAFARLKAAVEAHPDSLEPHEQFIRTVGLDSPVVLKQYTEWMKKYPKSAIVPMALGKAYCNSESPKAKPYLIKAVTMDPGLAEAWMMLSMDASRWGDENASREYMGKAAAAAPSDPGYSFYYAMDYEPIDPARWRVMLYDLARKFPAHERGAQGLYWLATRSTDTAEKVRVYELLRTSYPPANFSWSASGMSGLYDLYLVTAPSKALELANTMGPKDNWPQQAVLAQNIIDVNKLLAGQKFEEAVSYLDKIKTPRYSGAAEKISLLKSRVQDAAGHTQQAYDSLLVVVAKTPGDELLAALNGYGAKLGKNSTAVDADIWRRRDADTKPAPAFDLDLYTSTGKSSLADYKGKVVLLTFWFPGCGPCRGEFPHFETVMEKFRNKEVKYIGINVFPDQDDYVLPFMKGTHYSFIPLRATSDWAAATYKVRGEPTNFLIDQEGRIVFTNFRASDPHSERMLELMINSMLAHGKAN